MIKRSGRISSQQEKELLIKTKSAQGALKKKLERQIINANINLVKYMITRYFSYTKLDYEELLSEGIRSLPKAIEKFDINSKNRFAVYAGCWINQYIRSYIEKAKLIRSSASVKGKEIIYYDDNNYNKGDEKNSYYMLDIASEGLEAGEINRDNARQYDISKYTNNLLNSLGDRDTILFTRLFYKVNPHNYLDIYYIATDEEKELLVKEIKISKKIDTFEKREEFLSSLICEEKVKKSTVVQKYMQLFILTKSYKVGEIARIMGKSENYLRKIKQNCIPKLQLLAKERGIEASSVFS